MKKISVLGMLAAAVVMAQTPPDAELKIGEKLKQNAGALKRYTYKRRTQVILKDQPRGARVDLVRFVDGRMETVPLETPQRQDQPAQPRGLRGQMAARKKEEMKEDVERLVELVRSYLPSGSDSMKTIWEKAQVSRTGPEPDADVKVTVKGLVKPSDSVTLFWSVANQRPAKIDAHTDLDGKPVQVSVDYAALADGAFYPARTVISAPKKDLAIHIDNYDYALSGEVK